MNKLTYLAVLLALAGIVYGGALEPFTYSVQGQVDNNGIYYGDWALIKNVVNPVVMEIVYPSVNYDANVCFNSGSLQISGVNLEATCPVGGFGVLSNDAFSTAAKKAFVAEAEVEEEEERGVHQLKFARKGSRFVGNRMAMAVESDDESTVSTVDTTVDADVSVGSYGQFVVTVPGYNSTFTVSLSGMRCENADEYPIGGTGDDACQTITNVINVGAANGNNNTVALGARESAYYILDVPQTNFLTVTVSNTFSASLQSGYIPSDNFTLPSTRTLSEDGYLAQYVVNTPGRFSGSEQIFLRVENTINAAITGTVSVTISNCANNTIGPDCYVSPTTTTNSTTNGAEVLILNGEVDAGLNNGTSIEFDLSEAEQEYAYFVLPTYNQPIIVPNNGSDAATSSSFVRVSFANNVIDATGGQTVGPTVYAKADGYPSAQSYDLRVAGALVNQVMVPIDDPVDWYFAVETPSDFSVWAGTNCANECDNEEHGYCMCNNAICWNTTSTADPNTSQLYTLPTSTSDSAGACHCSDDNYSQSFDCSSKTNNNSTLYIVLIAVGGAIVLAVAIGVPVYCYFQNRKRARYDRV